MMQSYFAAEIMRYYLKGDGSANNPPRKIVYHDQKDGRVRLVIPPTAAQSLQVFQVTGHALDEFEKELDDRTSTVYICDCGATTAGQPVRRAAYRTIVLSSPNPEHYNQWQSSSRALKFYMPSWSKDEINAVVPHIWRQPVNAADKWSERFRLHGGIPRFVFDVSQTDEDLKEELVENSIKACMLTKVLSAIKSGKYAGKESLRLLHYVITIREDKLLNYRKATLDFVSDFIAEEFVKEQEHRQVSDIISFLNQAAGNPEVSGLRGKVFELHAHHVLPRGGEFRWRWEQNNDEQKDFLLPSTKQQGIKSSLAALAKGVGLSRHHASGQRL